MTSGVCTVNCLTPINNKDICNIKENRYNTGQCFKMQKQQNVKVKKFLLYVDRETHLEECHTLRIM